MDHGVDIRKDISNHCFILGIPDLQRSQYVVDAVDWVLQEYAIRNKWTDLGEIPLCILHSACLEIMSAHDHYLMNVDIPSWAEFIEIRGGVTKIRRVQIRFDWILSDVYDYIPLLYEVYAV
jgi:hypothetical protein